MIGNSCGGARGASICALALGLLLTACAPAMATAGQQTVAGRVTNDLTGEPLAGLSVTIYYNFTPFTYFVLGEPVTDADGRYAWTGTCPEASFPTPCFVELFEDGYLDAYQVFDYRDGDVTLDFALIPGATVSGDVTIDGAIADHGIDATIEYFNEDSGYWATPIAFTSEEGGGRYTLGRLPYDRSYRVCAGGIEVDVVRQCYDGHEQASLTSDPLYDLLSLDEGEHRDGIDFDFRSGGAIEGTLHDAYLDGPLANRSIEVRIYDTSGARVGSAPRISGGDGRYRVAGLPDGTYYAAVFADDDVFSDTRQIYPGVVCSISDCTPLADGQPITIANGSIVDGIDFTFHPDVVVEGHVTDAATGAALAGISLQTTHDNQALTTSEADGSYRFYVSHNRGTLSVATHGSQPRIDQVYPALPCIFGDCMTQGEALPATAGTVYRGIDFALALGASIAGRMTDATTGEALGGYVEMYDASFALVWAGTTFGGGSYASGAWVPGTYYVKAGAYNFGTNVVCAFYASRPCPDEGVDPAAMTPTPIVLASGEVRSGIDFAFSADTIFASGFDP